MAQKITFETGVPAILALKFAEGKLVDTRYGDEFQFTTTDERIFWLKPEAARDVHDELRAQGIKVGEEFKLTKCKTSHGGSRFVVERAVSPRRGDAGGHHVPERARQASEAPAPTWDDLNRVAPHVDSAATIAATAEPTPASLRFMGAYKDAVDTLIEMRVYAQRKGLALEIRCEDIRCLAATIMIDAQKGGR